MAAGNEGSVILAVVALIAAPSSRVPLWLHDISAIMYVGCPGPIARPLISEHKHNQRTQRSFAYLKRSQGCNCCRAIELRHLRRREQRPTHFSLSGAWRHRPPVPPAPRDIRRPRLDFCLGPRPANEANCACNAHGRRTGCPRALHQGRVPAAGLGGGYRSVYSAKLL